jgi:hypothetical protein
MNNQLSKSHRRSGFDDWLFTDTEEVGTVRNRPTPSDGE